MQAFSHNKERGTQDFELVLVGHSLGAGTASILAILLRQDYPTLQCFAYSPPGGSLRQERTLKCEHGSVQCRVLGNENNSADIFVILLVCKVHGMMPKLSKCNPTQFYPLLLDSCPSDFQTLAIYFSACQGNLCYCFHDLLFNVLHISICFFFQNVLNSFPQKKCRVVIPMTWAAR